MKSTEIINHRQFAWMVGSLIAAAGIISLHTALIRINRMDAYFSYILSILYAFCIGFFFYYLANRFPGKNLFEIAFSLAGKWAGGFINMLFLVHMWLLLIRDVRSYSKYVKIIMLPNTPEGILLLVLVCLLIFFGRFNIEVAVRTNDIFFPIFLIFVLLLPLTLANEISPEFLQPMLVNSWRNLLTGNLLSVGWYGELFVLGAFLHALPNSRQIRAAVRHGTMIGTIVLTVFILLELVVLGWDIPANTFIPSYILVQQIHITDFLDRLDLVLLSIWFFIEVVKIIFIYLAFLICIGCFFGERYTHLFNKPAGLVILMTSLIFFRNPAELSNFGNFSSIFIVAAYQPFVFILLLILAARKRKHSHARYVRPSNNRPGGPRQAEQNGQGGNGHALSRFGSRPSWLLNFSLRYKLEKWMRISNLLLLAALIFIAIGWIFSHRVPLVSSFSGLAYGLCLALCLFSTLMELLRASRQ